MYEYIKLVWLWHFKKRLVVGWRLSWLFLSSFVVHPYYYFFFLFQCKIILWLLGWMELGAFTLVDGARWIDLISGILIWVGGKRVGLLVDWFGRFDWFLFMMLEWMNGWMNGLNTSFPASIEK